MDSLAAAPGTGPATSPLPVLRKSRPAAQFKDLPTDRTLVMGILNVTPDSFSDGGRHATADTAIAAGLRMFYAGADIIDVGGESPRPGATQGVPREEPAPGGGLWGVERELGGKDGVDVVPLAGLGAAEGIRLVGPR